MPTSDRNPTSGGLSEVLVGLLEAGVDFILVGGLVAVIQGAPVTTMDVDIVHSQSLENIDRLLAFLKSVEAVHRRVDDKVIARTSNIAAQRYAPDCHSVGASRQPVMPYILPNTKDACHVYEHPAD